MTVHSPIDEVNERFREIERRLRDLESGTPADRTTVRGRLEVVDDMTQQERVVIGEQSDGSTGIWILASDGETVLLKLDTEGLRMLDADSDERVHIGDLGSSRYGIRVLDSGGSYERFRIDDRGVVRPEFASHFIPLVNDTSDTRLIRVTGAAFAAYYRTMVRQMHSAGVEVIVACTTDVGTTAEFRLNTLLGATSAVAVSSGGAVVKQFRWLHPYDLDSVGGITFDVECRRTGGAGNAYIWLPQQATFTDASLCTATGV